MRNLILFDDKNVWTDLLPITYTRPLADIRIGIMTIRQKWQMRFPDAVVSALTMPYLSKKYPTTDADCSTFIAGHILPDDSLAEAIGNLPVGTALMAATSFWLSADAVAISMRKISQQYADTILSFPLSTSSTTFSLKTIVK